MEKTKKSNIIDIVDNKSINAWKDDGVLFITFKLNGVTLGVLEEDWDNCVINDLSELIIKTMSSECICNDCWKALND